MRIEIKDKKNFINMFNDLFTDNQIQNINGISIDSRKIKKNDIYIPLKGENFDGHDFIDEAIISGAIICFSEKHIKNTIKIKSSIDLIKKISKEWNKRSNHQIIGITGSNGKTTTKELLFSILNEYKSCYKSIGNFNSTIGLPISYLSSKKTDKFCIIEYGASKPNEIKELCSIIKPNISLITNISNAHIKNYKSTNDIYNTKKAIFDCLEKNDIAFINLDDNYIKGSITSSNRVTFSYKHKSEYVGKTNSDSFFINDKKINISDEIFHLNNIILPVYAICSELGITHDEINRIISKFKLPKGRGKKILLDQVEIIDDSYNANPASVILAIERFHSTISKGNKIFILGDMLELGDKSKSEHSRIGDYINDKKINIVITYGINSINTYNYIKNKKIKKYHFDKMSDLKLYLRKNIKKNDTIYLKGSRSMKLEKIYEKGLA